jgi:hypothetical protein
MCSFGGLSGTLVDTPCEPLYAARNCCYKPFGPHLDVRTASEVSFHAVCRESRPVFGHYKGVGGVSR